MCAVRACFGGNKVSADKVSGTVMSRLERRKAVSGRYLGSWGSPGDESSLPGGTINGS